MRIIEISALDNGAHRNQEGTFYCAPEGWAIIPDDLETPNFPFGDITVDDQTPPLVTKWTPLPIPDPDPAPDPDPTTEDRVAALEAENATIKEQLQQADDTAIELYEANMAQEEINAAQDDALIEIYELIGG